MSTMRVGEADRVGDLRVQVAQRRGRPIRDIMLVGRGSELLDHDVIRTVVDNDHGELLCVWIRPE